MKLGFVTCVQLGLTCMEAIETAGFKLDKVFTLKDDMAAKKSGRVYLDQFAASHGAELYKIKHVNDEEAIEQFRQLDWLFIIGWSQIAGPEVIRAPKKGVLGIHPTLLPEGRGRAAIPWAIIKGLAKTGVTLFRLDEGVDTGPIAAQLEIPLQSGTTAADLYARVNDAHAELIKSVLPSMASGEVEFEEQDESKASNWPGRKPEDGQIDIDGSVFDAERLIRAVTHPYPGAFVFDDNGRKRIIWAAKITDGMASETSLVFSDGYLAIVDSEIECPD